MLKLYYAPETCALASHIALEQAGAKYEAVRVDFSVKEENSPEYLRQLYFGKFDEADRSISGKRLRYFA